MSIEDSFFIIPTIHSIPPFYLLVNNFQSISAAVTRQRENQDQTEELARMKEELHLELVKHDQQMQTAR